MDNEITGSKLNEILTSLPILHCKKCQQFLLPPIRLVAGIGHVCGSCDLPDNAVAIRDSALEMIFQNLTISCPNASNGCKENLKYDGVTSHISACPNRSDPCPFRVVTDCLWEGSSSDVADHATVQHPEDVIRADDGVFPLKVNVTITNDTIKILQMGCEKFILRAKCDVSNSKLQYFVYYMGSTERAQEFSYSMEQKGSDYDDYSIRHNSQHKILHSANFNLDGGEDCAVSVNLSLLKQLTEAPLVETLIRITSPTKNEDLDERLLNFFECPVCNSFMKPPIFQCLSGHSICNRCKPKLGQCPSCRTGFGNTRNYILESMSNGIKFPCTYRDLGCNAIQSVSDINKHELECQVRPYSCPFMELNRCSWDGSYHSIIKHLKEKHAEKCKFGNYAKVCAGFSYDHNFSEMYCMVVNGDIFRVCHKRDMGNHNTYWAVQYVGPRAEAKNFECEIGLLDVKSDNRKLIRHDICHELTTFDSMFNQCIMLPSNVVSWFSNNGQLTYYCKIKQINNVA